MIKEEYENRWDKRDAAEQARDEARLLLEIYDRGLISEVEIRFALAKIFPEVSALQQ